MGFLDSLFGGNSGASSSAPQNQILQTPDSSHSFLDTFNKTNWSNATVQERMDAYQNLEHFMAQEQGRAERQVVFEDFSKTLEDGDGVVGYYSSNDDKLHMDMKYLTGERNPYDGMDTVIHEGRHAYQHDCINGYATPDDKIAPNMQGMRDNFATGDYHSSNDPFYDLQPAERDSFTYANDVMSRPDFAEHFEGDADYKNYCDAQRMSNDNKAEEYKHFADEYKNDLSNNAARAQSERDSVLSNPNSTAEEIAQANENVNRSNEELARFENDNYTNGEYDIEKSGNSLSHNDFENNPNAEYSTPTSAQAQTNYMHNEFPDKPVEPWCTDFDTISNPDHKYGPVDDSVYNMQGSGEQNQQDISSPQQVSNDENSNDQNAFKYESAGAEPKQDSQKQNTDMNQEAGAKPRQDNAQENNNFQTQNQEAGAKPSQDNAQENNNSQTQNQEAGAKPSQDNAQENNNSQPQNQEAGAKPSQDNAQENNNSQPQNQEAGAKPSHDESPSQNGVDASQSASDTGQSATDAGKETANAGKDAADTGKDAAEGAYEAAGMAL